MALESKAIFLAPGIPRRTEIYDDFDFRSGKDRVLQTKKPQDSVQRTIGRRAPTRCKKIGRFTGKVKIVPSFKVSTSRTAAIDANPAASFMDIMHRKIAIILDFEAFGKRQFCIEAKEWTYVNNWPN